MEILKVLGGFAAVAVLVVLFGLDRNSDEAAALEALEVPAPIDRSFSAQDTSARFEPVVVTE